jgi:hypothetical protein
MFTVVHVDVMGKLSDEGTSLFTRIESLQARFPVPETNIS